MFKKFKDKQIFWENPSHLTKLIKSLKTDEISIVSTDTIYGFLSNLTINCFNKLNQLKGKRDKKPYLILIGSEKKLKKFIDTKNSTPTLLKMIKKCWPGPVTLIFKAKKDLPPHLISKEKTVALRYPNHVGLQTILKSFDGLFSTSANKTIETPPITQKEININLLEKTKFFVNNLKNKDKKYGPSTILDCSDPKKIKIVRTGIYTIEKLEQYYDSKFEK